MVELWGSALSLVGSILSIGIELILCDAFFPRKNCGRRYGLWTAAAIAIGFVFSTLVGGGYGYACKMLFEVALYFVLCAALYQSRWDRRLFFVVTSYAVLYSFSYWGDVLCMSLLGLTYQFVLEFLQLQIVHVEPTVNSSGVEQKLMGWDGKQRPGEFPDAGLVEVLQVLRSQNQGGLLLSHPFQTVSDVGHRCWVGEP